MENVIQISPKKHQTRVVIKGKLSLLFVNGKWMARYRDTSAKAYHHKTLCEDYEKSLDEALLFFGKLNTREEKGQILKDASLDKLINDYLKIIKHRVSSNRVSPYRYEFIKYALGKMKEFFHLHNQQSLDKFFKIYNEEYEIRTCSNLKPSSFHAIVNVHKQFHKYLVKKNAVNIEIELKTSPPAKGRDIFPEHQFKSFIKTLRHKVKTSKPPYLCLRTSHLAMVEICYLLGLRSVEVVQLKASSLTGNSLKVSGKGKQRVIVIPDKAIRIIKKQIDFNKSQGFKSDYLFVQRNGQRYEQVSNAYIRQCLKESRIEGNLSIGSLRHLFLTSKLAEGVNPSMLVDYCGTSLNVLNTYQHFTSKQIFEEIFQ